MAETPKDRFLWIKTLREEVIKARNQSTEKEDITQLQVFSFGAQEISKI